MDEKKPKKKRYVIYTRCSTDDQAQGEYTTLDAQAHHCKNMIDAFGYELADFGNKGIINDDGYSGKDMKRPGIQSILNSINKNREFDGIIFFRLDRLTRNPRDLYAIIDLFKDKEIDFVSVRENLDSSTAIGRIVIGILGLLSAFERELTGERVKASAIARVRQGRWVGGSLPYGYKLINNGPPLNDGRQPHKIVLNNEIAPKLKIIFEMAADNKSLAKIGLELSKQGIKSPKGKEWRKQSVLNIIKSPFYKGYVKYLDELHKGKHPAIIDEITWSEANRIITARLPGHKFTKKPSEYNYLLSGLLRCPKCKSYYISVSCTNHSKRKYFYYVCGRSKQGLGCNMPEISATAFDQALIQYFNKASKDQKILIKAIGNAILDAKTKLIDYEKTIRKQGKQLESAKTESKKLLNLALKGKISQGRTYKDRMAELDKEILELESTLSKLQAQKSVAQMTANSGQFLYSNIRFALKYLDQSPPEAQKSLIRALIKEVQVYDDKIELQMYINKPLEGTMPCNMPPIPKENTSINGKRLAKKSEALTDVVQSSSNRQESLPETFSDQTTHLSSTNQIRAYSENPSFWLTDAFSYSLVKSNNGGQKMITKWGYPPVNLKDTSLTLGARIKALRIKAGLKQADLAESAGLGTSVLARYEQGKILDLTPQVLQKIAKVLTIEPLELLPVPNHPNSREFLDYFCPSDTSGSRIRKLRLNRNLHQKDLANMLGLHKVSVCRYEKDRSKPSKIITEKIDKILRTI